MQKGICPRKEDKFDDSMSVPLVEPEKPKRRAKEKKKEDEDDYNNW